MGGGPNNSFAEDLKAAPIVAILRGITPEKVVGVAEALHDGGVRFIEITMNSPDPVASISLLAAKFAGTGVHVGAGTVLKPEEAGIVAAAGGTFVVSPNLDLAVVHRTKELGRTSIPGFFTPTEAFAAVEAGADCLKCFPVSVLGPGYLKALKAVLPAPVIAVGGIDLKNVSDFLRVSAGAGIGSALYSPKKTLEDIRKDTTIFVRTSKAL